MNINVQVLCSSCKECDLFSIEEENLWADNKVYGKLFYCKNLEICQKAVEIWEKQNDFQKERKACR